MKKNLLLIVADQFRADALGCAGKYGISTPNIDALAAGGMRFSQAYTPLPVCAPARQAMLCGKNPDSCGAFWNYGFFAAHSLEPGRYWTDKLRDAGYSTAFIGKWNVSEKHAPTEFGYDKYISMSEYSDMRRSKYPNARSFDWFGGESDIPLADSKTHWLAAKTAECIKQCAENGKPWHIQVDYTDPHLPNEPSAPFAGMYDPDGIVPWDGVGDTLEGKPYIQKQQLMSWGIDKMTWDDWKPAVARYYGMVSQIDDSVGIILRALRLSGQADDTVVMFTSDHGDMCGSRGMLDKHYVLYDDVVRIPFIVSGGKSGVCDDFVSLLDLSPTFEELFGLEAGEYDGMSLVPLLNGEAPDRRRVEITASSNGQQFGFYNQRMLRDKKFKYIWNLTDIDELYDLGEDPAEKTNLAYDVRYAEVVADMRRRLHAELKRQGDPFVKSGWVDRQLLEGKKH